MNTISGRAPVGSRQNPVGNPMLSRITILKAEGQYAQCCSGYYYQFTAMIDQNATNPQVVVCPQAFLYGRIDKGYPWVPDEGLLFAQAVTCDFVDYDVSSRMITLGLSILYQYFHFRHLFAPVSLSFLPDDYGLRPSAPGLWNKIVGLFLVESHVWFANEFFWTLKCRRFFERPVRTID